IVGDIDEDIYADEIEEAKSTRLRPADGWTGERIDLFDRVAVFEHRPDGDERAVGADAIGDEVRAVFGDDDAFAQSLVQKSMNRARDFRCGPLRADEFDQMQVARRIEEVRAEKVGAEIFRK